ncbi:ABC-2 transporter permease [Ruminococcus flavefaciens]|uniref:ABC-2 transporter permease n=1 Tax=Ruminococcus flavefaciens TaxID=1265 RepID=UPI0002FDF796|nr:ABC-2 transporter permease [Ruminococcus flavefaciens]
MKKIIDLIRVDLISAKGRNKGIFFLILALTAIFVAIGMLTEAIFMVFSIVVLGVMLVPFITMAEKTHNAGKIFTVIPADRKSIVISRFALTTGIYTVFSAFIFILYLIMEKFGELHGTVLSKDVNELYDKTSGFGTGIQMKALENSMFWLVFAVTLMVMAGQHRKYFKKGISSKSNSMLRSFLKFLGGIALVYAIAAAIIYIFNIDILKPALIVLLNMIMALAAPMNGMLLSIVLIFIGFGFTLYQLVCSVVDYEAREL